MRLACFYTVALCGGAIMLTIIGLILFLIANYIGANKVIDYTKEDFTKNGETYEVIFDTVGMFATC